MTPATIKVNDRRNDKRDASEKLREVAATKEPEKIHAAIHEEIRGFFRARMTKKTDGTYQPVTITSPDHEQLEEVARSVTTGILKLLDEERSWTVMLAKQLQVGDVLTLYRTIDGKPCDQEVSVLGCKQKQGNASKQAIKVRWQDGTYGEFEASSEYAFHVHRPAAEIDE